MSASFTRLRGMARSRDLSFKQALINKLEAVTESQGGASSGDDTLLLCGDNDVFHLASRFFPLFIVGDSNIYPEIHKGFRLGPQTSL